MTSHFVQVNDLNFHYLAQGPGKPTGEDGHRATSAVVLLHGWPQTSDCWNQIITDLARDHLVIAPDLRGYGLTDKPLSGFDKRTMASDVRGIMDSLGVESAHIVGHDRGARVAHRLALDSPERVETLAVLDIAPTHAMFTGGRMETAEGYFHWLFHMQKDLPEALTAGRVGPYLRYFFERWTFRRDRLDPHIDGYIRSFEQPGAMRSGFNDYRATHEDLAHDQVDADNGAKISAPLLALWGAQGLAANTQIAEVWNRYAENVLARPIENCGHFIPEEAPEELLAELRSFWAECDPATP